MNISDKISEIKTEAKALLDRVSLVMFLEGIAHHLETEYSKHKNFELWEEEVSTLLTAKEGERRGLYFSWLIGPLNELIQYKIINDGKNPESPSVQRKLIEKVLYLCGPIRWLSQSEILIRKYGWELRKIDNYYEVRPRNQQAENRVTDSFRDAATFRLFGGMAKNLRQIGYVQGADSTESISKKMKKLTEREMQLFPEKLVPNERQPITEKEIKQIVGSEIYKDLCEVNRLDFYEFIAPGLGHDKEEIIVKVPEGEIPLSDAIAVAVLLSQIARLQVEQIDRHVMHVCKNAQDEALRKFPQADLYAQIKARAMRKPNKKRHELLGILSQNPEIAESQDYQENFILKQLDHSLMLSTFKVSELGQWIAKALNMTFSNVKKAFSILDYVRSIRDNKDYSFLNHQVLFVVKEHIHWFPNALSYTSSAELLFNTVLGQELLIKKQAMSSMTENVVLSWFRDAQFDKIACDDHDYGPVGNPLGDFDALAYKDGHLYHLEIKLTSIRNDLTSKLSFGDSKLHKARKQLSQGRKYILNNKEEIRRRLNLKRDELITEHKTHSYLVSNVVDFDKQKFGGYLKFSLMELYVVLKEADNLMCWDQETYLRHMILRFEHLLKAPLPTPFKGWYEQTENFPEEATEQLFRYIQFNKNEISEQLELRSTHPLWAIENNWYTMRDKLYIAPIRYCQFEIDGKLIVLPEV